MPTLSQVHVDAALTDFSVATAMQMQSSFVARRAFPVSPSGKQSNKYFVYTAADLLRAEAQKRAPNTQSAGRDYNLSTDSYFCDVWAIHYDVSEQEAANADPILDPEEDAARILVQDLLMTEDREWAATAFVTGVWDTDVVGGTNFTVWDDTASTPIETIRAGITTVLGNTGQKPNKLVIGWETWSEGLADHPDILDRIKHTQTGVITPQLLAGVLDLDEVIIGSSIRNTALEGATASQSFNLGKNALLVHAPNNIGPRTPAAGRTFVWSGLQGASNGYRTKRYEIPEDDAYPRVEVDAAFDHKVTATSLGYFFSGAVA